VIKNLDMGYVALAFAFLTLTLEVLGDHLGTRAALAPGPLAGGTVLLGGLAGLGGVRSGLHVLGATLIVRNLAAGRLDDDLAHLRRLRAALWNGVAGIDGVMNDIDPLREGWGPADAKDCDTAIQYALLPRHLNEALEALEEDQDFLLRDGVFTKELIEQWLKLKWQEVQSMATMPNPNEYTLYFNL